MKCRCSLKADQLPSVCKVPSTVPGCHHLNRVFLGFGVLFKELDFKMAEDCNQMQSDSADQA